MGSAQLKSGSKVFVRPSGGLGKKERGMTIQRVSREKLVLKVPDLGERLFLKKGEKVRVKYWDEEAIYYAEAQVLEPFSSSAEALVLTPLEGIVSLQRRKAMRLEKEIPFRFSILSAANPRLTSEQEHDALTRDISAGGLRFESELALKDSDELLVSLPLGPTQRLHTLGRVVRCQAGSAPRRTLVSVEFVTLESEEQNRLLQFLEESENS